MKIWLWEKKISLTGWILSHQGPSVCEKVTQLPVQMGVMLNNWLIYCWGFGDEYHYGKREHLGFTRVLQKWEYLFKRKVYPKFCKSGFLHWNMWFPWFSLKTLSAVFSLCSSHVNYGSRYLVEDQISRFHKEQQTCARHEAADLSGSDSHIVTNTRMGYLYSLGWETRKKQTKRTNLLCMGRIPAWPD